MEDLPDQPQDLTGELVPPDDGFSIPGDGTFNTPSLIEAADTGPFFHNNSVETIEAAVAFYDGESFNNSPAGELIINATGSGIDLDDTQIVEIDAFLRVINTLENIRQRIEMLSKFEKKNFRIEQVNYQNQTLTMSDNSHSYSIKISDRTMFFLDRSKLKQTNRYGTLADCKKGVTAEVRFENDERGGPAEWIKLQIVS